MTPEQEQRYRETGRCPSCDSNEITTGSREDVWEPYELPEDSSLLVSKSCGACNARWIERFEYRLASVSFDNEEEVTQ